MRKSTYDPCKTTFCKVTFFTFIGYHLIIRHTVRISKNLVCPQPVAHDSITHPGSGTDTDNTPAASGGRDDEQRAPAAQNLSVQVQYPDD